MDTLDNIRTFLTVVRTGSFSAAARALGLVPSVVSKRISQLEHTLRTTLFIRSTRRLQLTEPGRRHHQRLLAVMTDLEDALRDQPDGAARLQEHLRVKCPTTLAILYFGDILTEFRVANPGVRLDLVLVDRSVNPLEEGFDLAIGALPTSYPNVVDVPLCSMARKLVAAPHYLDRCGHPAHPRDLTGHDCIVFPATGTGWSFEGPAGPVSVEVDSCFSANDSQVLLKAAERGLGIAIIAAHIARASLAAGRVVEVLPEFRLPDLLIKALIPENRRANPALQALLRAFHDACTPVAPWDRAVDASGVPAFAPYES